MAASRVFRTWSRRVVVGAALLYPAALALTLLAFSLIGERFWITAAALYLPRAGFAVPLPFLLVALFLYRFRRLLLLQALSGILILVLMGFALPVGRGAPDGAKTLRVLSLNVCSGYFGDQRIVQAVNAYSPDIVLLQEVVGNADEMSRIFGARYPHVEVSTQFVVASRFPITSSTDPARLPFYGKERSPRFMRHSIATPLGSLAVYNVHPISPRDALRSFRRGGFRHAITSGELVSGAARPDVEKNMGLRRLQLAAIADHARRETDPIVIAGDTNSPALSVALSESLGDFRDAFREDGFGFGHTYPTRLPFLRLDRIFVSRALGVAHFETGCHGVSDHLCVVADVYRK